MSLLPATLVKTIKFKRMNNKHIKGYEIYGVYQDDNFESGIREDLIDYFDNPSEPNTERVSLVLEYNDNYTWELPKDLYTDRDHKFRIYINDAILSTLYYQYNKYNRFVTIDKNLKPLNVNDKIKIEYFRDMITRTYPLESNCQIKIRPVFADTYTYGNHNVII